MLSASGYRGPPTLRGYAILPLFAILAWIHSCWNKGGAMEEKRSWWQNIKLLPVRTVLIAMIAVLIILIILIILGYIFN